MARRLTGAKVKTTGQKKMGRPEFENYTVGDIEALAKELRDLGKDFGEVAKKLLTKGPPDEFLMANKTSVQQAKNVLKDVWRRGESLLDRLPDAEPGEK